MQSSTSGKKPYTFNFNNIFIFIGIIILIFGWKVWALVINAEIILPSPEKVLKEIVSFLWDLHFWQSIAASMGRVAISFLLSLFLGVILGGLAGYNRIVHALILPFLAVLKATPLMSIILISLIWFHTGIVPIFVCFLMSFPIIASNIIEGIASVDKKLIDMATVYKLGFKKKVFKIYLPSIKPFFVSAAATSLAISWKVVVAAEVLSQPVWGMGTGLQNSKIGLETAKVFAWTAFAILFSAATELLFRKMVRLRVSRRMNRVPVE
jgi:NitT/TauT family transport system permease protein